MQDASDMELLKEYEQHGSEEAFATLVERHVHLVYSVAFRHVGNAAHAEEITQAVFVILARKAAGLRPNTILEGWLYETTRLTSLRFLRNERRRQFREHEACMQSNLQDSSADSTWNQLAPLLDEAVSGLGQKDRDAVMLRYFKDKSLREVAAALNINESAAQRRVLRAVEKLRLFFARRGIVVPAAAMIAMISDNSIHAAPAALAKTATAVAMLKGTTASSSTVTLIEGVLKLMAWTKAKTAIVIGLGAVLATTVTIKEIQVHRGYAWQNMVDGGSEAMRALDTTPPQVTIVRSKFAANQPPRRLFDDVGSPDRWRFIATRVTPGEIVQAAYSGDDNHINNDKPFLVVRSADLPGGFYDYIANLPNGSRDSLQALARKKFGLTGKYEIRDMNVLVLKLDHPDAPGLKPGTAPAAGQSTLSRVSGGLIHYRNKSISDLAGILESRLEIPVVDQTGLTGRYDFDFPDRLSIEPDTRLETIRQSLLDRFGLVLESARQPHEVFVIEKVK